ncbi:unnamed protein product [Durusdinium trenchii]|uniref:Uncharacterized protein n=1 Tax=Durusdinium trenchii TaxID=1381693 RepID=A0ABP0KSR7_9DINO
MAKPDEEKLREELKVLLQAQELQELSLRRDAMMQKAQAAEAAVEAERQAMDDLERECHSFDLRKRQANEEEANSQSLAENISAELQTFGPANISTESKKGGKGGKNGKGKGKAIVVSPPAALQEEIASLRAQVAQERQRAAQEDEAQERATRARVEEQCMLLRALIDMVTGSGELSKANWREEERDLGAYGVFMAEKRRWATNALGWRILPRNSSAFACDTSPEFAKVDELCHILPGRSQDNFLCQACEGKKASEVSKMGGAAWKKLSEADKVSIAGTAGA